MAYKNIQQLRRLLGQAGGATIQGEPPAAEKQPKRASKRKPPDTTSEERVRFVLVLPMPPSANRYWRNFKGVTVVSEEATEYKRFVKAMPSAHGVTPATGPLAIWLVFYFARRGADLDNRIKVALDAMQGIYYANDSQFDEIHMRRLYDKKNPRVEIVIESMTSQS